MRAVKALRLRLAWWLFERRSLRLRKRADRVLKDLQRERTTLVHIEVPERFRVEKK